MAEPLFKTKNIFMGNHSRRNWTQLNSSLRPRKRDLKGTNLLRSESNTTPFSLIRTVFRFKEPYCSILEKGWSIWLTQSYFQLTTTGKFWVKLLHNWETIILQKRKGEKKRRKKHSHMQPSNPDAPRVYSLEMLWQWQKLWFVNDHTFPVFSPTVTKWKGSPYRSLDPLKPPSALYNITPVGCHH